MSSDNSYKIDQRNISNQDREVVTIKEINDTMEKTDKSEQELIQNEPPSSRSS